MTNATKCLTLAMTLLIGLRPTPGVAGEPQIETPLRSPRVPFADAKLIIEHNATAGDTGFQVFLDGEPWNRLTIEGPGERPLLDITARGRLRTLGLTELFFETNEPANDDLPIAELLARFPAGVYEFEGRSIEGAEMVGRARLTHAIPEGPEIVSPDPGAVVDPGNAVIRWRGVTRSITGSPVQIVGYEVLVTKITDVHPPGFSKPALSIHVSAAIRSLTVPREFFEAATAYDFEVLALEVGGNQTISAGTFVTP